MKTKKKENHGITAIGSEFTKVKTKSDCYEIAAVDAKDESEVASAWYTCLDEVFNEVTEVKFMGETVSFQKFDFQGVTNVVAVIQRNGKSAKVSLESIKWIKPNRIQSIWHKAYLEWLEGNS